MFEPIPGLLLGSGGRFRGSELTVVIWRVVLRL